MGIGLTEEATVIEYRPRIADGELAERMDSAGAVLIEVEVVRQDGHGVASCLDRVPDGHRRQRP